MWAWPEILGWPTDITWLFSPPTGKSVWPGDLWGIDDSGELIIVETKSSLVPRDPFEDLLPFQERLTSGAWKPTLGDLFKHWEPLISDERRFLEISNEKLQDGSGQRCEWPGIVPYSCKRLAHGAGEHFILNGSLL